MTTKIIGNQIDAVTRAIITALDVTEQINLPDLNQTQVNSLGTPAFGTLVYNTTEDQAQIYLQDAQSGNPGWASVGGGGPSVGENSIIRTNGTTIAENLTVGPTANGGVEFTNGFTAGPVEIANGYTVTVENGATWMIMGQDDLNIIGSTEITTQHLYSHGTLMFSETQENITYYSGSGDITHDWTNNNVIYLTKTGGGNWTLNLNNVPAEQMGYGVTVIVANGGGTGIPSSLNINGSSNDIYWGGGQPSHSDTYCVVSFAIVNQMPIDGTSQLYTVFGSGSNYS